jgi:hypothetical protein
MLSLGLLGRSKLVLQILSGIIGAAVIAPLASKLLLSADSRLLLERALATALGVLLLLSAAMIFNSARRRGLVERATVWAAVATWIAATLVFVAVRPVTAEPRLIGDILGAGVLVLIVVPLAAAPLALSLNRHR